MESRRMPYLRETVSSKQLIVQGKPFLIRGAELQNSSFSSVKHMSTLWQKLKNMNCNTILGSVSWEMVEPDEGTFDFSVIDRMIEDARKADLKLILLWFGAWKNGISTYAPAWVKMNPKRFPRVIIRERNGNMKTTEILSCMHEELLHAATKAFVTFLKHLCQIDYLLSTVIMIQVENEIGVLGDSRDRSAKATGRFHSPVPDGLLNYLQNEWSGLHRDLKSNLARFRQRSGSSSSSQNWPETFGDNANTDEIFMAYHYAIFLDSVACAGKKEYNIPMFANFWLNYARDDQSTKHPVLAGGGNLPGDYPSGGAVSTVLDIWMRFAPNLDLLCPDTYLNDYYRVCSTYRHKGRPLFIPEQRRDEFGARRTWAAIGEYLALGACPFALDTLDVEACAYTHHYELLAKVEDVILDAQQRQDAIAGFFFDELQGPDDCQSRPSIVTEMNGYRLLIERAFTTGAQGAGYGAVIAWEESPQGPGTAKFLLVGAGFQVKFNSLDEDAKFTGILDFVELDRDPVSLEWERLRRLNGDETRSGHQAIMPNFGPDNGGFPISITIPAVTRIAECVVYHIV